MKNKTTTNDDRDTPIIHCPELEIFQTTVSIGNGKTCLRTDILGIKCKSGKATLLREFLLRATPDLETKGQGKFIAASLANVIRTETMKTMIWHNNQYLKSIATIPVNGIPPKALTTKIILDEEAMKLDQTKTTVKNYLLDWCHGLKPMDQEGRYFLITTTQQLTEACKWLDKNLEAHL